MSKDPGNTERMRKRRGDLVAAGLCVACGVAPPRSGLQTCAPCGKRASKQAAEFEHARSAAGLCVECGGPARPAKKKCQGCADKRSARLKARRDLARAGKLCPVCCVRPPAFGSQHCSVCGDKREHSRRAYAEAKRVGVCWQCSSAPAAPGRTSCGACTDRKRWQEIRRKYGLTRETYGALLSEQGGGCGCCGAESAGRRDWTFLVVDHDHRAGLVRGLLCHQCNTMLGKLGDDVERFRRLIQYLGGEAPWQKRRLPPLNRMLNLFPRTG